jgi:hypothetical protein
LCRTLLRRPLHPRGTVPARPNHARARMPTDPSPAPMRWPCAQTRTWSRLLSNVRRRPIILILERLRKRERVVLAVTTSMSAPPVPVQGALRSVSRETRVQHRPPSVRRESVGPAKLKAVEQACVIPCFVPMFHVKQPPGLVSQRLQTGQPDTKLRELRG